MARTRRALTHNAAGSQNFRTRSRDCLRSHAAHLSKLGARLPSRKRHANYGWDQSVRSQIQRQLRLDRVGSPTWHRSTRDTQTFSCGPKPPVGSCGRLYFAWESRSRESRARSSQVAAMSAKAFLISGARAFSAIARHFSANPW